MLSCWSHDAGDRPTFQSLQKILEALLEKGSGYLKLAESLKEQDSLPCPAVKVDELQMEESSVDAKVHRCSGQPDTGL